VGESHLLKEIAFATLRVIQKRVLQRRDSQYGA